MPEGGRFSVKGTDHIVWRKISTDLHHHIDKPVDGPGMLSLGGHKVRVRIKGTVHNAVAVNNQ